MRDVGAARIAVGYCNMADDTAVNDQWPAFYRPVFPACQQLLLIFGSLLSHSA